MTRPQDNVSTNDPLPGLGERIPASKPAAPPATPRPTGTPGVLEGPDGKLYTELPENDKIGWTRIGTGRFAGAPAALHNLPKAAVPSSAPQLEDALADYPCLKCGWGRLCFGDCDDEMQVWPALRRLP